MMKYIFQLIEKITKGKKKEETLTKNNHNHTLSVDNRIFT